MIFSRIYGRNLRSSFNACSWFLCSPEQNHQFLFSHHYHSPGGSLNKDKLDPFSLVADELSLISIRLREMVVAEVPHLSSAAEYFFKMGVEGKRFRPTVLLLMSTALNPPLSPSDPAGTLTTELRSRQQKLAEITEMIHVASLLHDDVLDDANTRRGIGSVNHVMGNKWAVLAGNFLLSRATVTLASLKNNEVVSLMATIIEHLVRGEIKQVTTTSDQRCSMEYYMEKTYYKTASLISNSCQSSAVLARQTTEVQKLAFEYGKNLGLAYQLIDDVLDFTGTSASLGKGSLSDIKHVSDSLKLYSVIASTRVRNVLGLLELISSNDLIINISELTQLNQVKGIVTAPLLFAMEEFPQLTAVIKVGFHNPANVDIALDYLEKSQGIQRTRELAFNHAKLAELAIESLPANDDEDVKISRRALCDLTQRIITRTK